MKRFTQFEPNDSFGQATALAAVDQTLNDLTIHAPMNDDYFTWTAPASGTLTVDALFAHALGDLDLFLYDGCDQLQV